MRNEVIEVLRILGEHGEAYLVGGSVRDFVLGCDKGDVDIATSLSPERVKELFLKCYDLGRSQDFGVVGIFYKGVRMEIAEFRKDGVYSDGRRPDSVQHGVSFEDDVKRRDFTINAMGMDAEGNVIDFVGGMEDIEKGIIRTVGNPSARFGEDYLRMLRAVRFSSRFSFHIDIDTFYAITQNAEKITGISGERIFQELYKMADYKTFGNSVRLMRGTGLLKYVIPGVDALVGCEHGDAHPEGDAYEHTVAAIEYYDGDDPVINLSILLHDIGKSATYDPDNRSFKGHARVGSDMIDELTRKWGVENHLRDTFKFVAENHMKFHDFDKLHDKTVMEMIAHPAWMVLQEVGQCDDECRGAKSDLGKWDRIAGRSVELAVRYKTHKIIEKIKSVVNGTLIMNARKIKPGPEVGAVQRAAVDWVINTKVGLDETERIWKFVEKVKVEDAAVSNQSQEISTL